MGRVQQRIFVIPAIREEDLSPEMRALNDSQRRFVWAMLETGGGDHTAAARMAGYGEAGARVRGFELTHNQKVLDALKVESVKRMSAAAMGIVTEVVEIAMSRKQTTGDRLKAAGMVMDRVGMPAVVERHVITQDERRTREDLLRELFKIAREVEVPVGRLAAPVIEGRVEAETRETGDD